MKRSQALETIEWLLLKGDGNISKQELAVIILYNLEKIGMKPPIKKRCPVLLTETHVWEPEND